ncbi:hypothetical protein BC826DRAFT_1006302 [Russula brevipes]|nr:hypothetical protein BC826DRAFT_1006302 [Russula brevipes]
MRRTLLALVLERSPVTPRAARGGRNRVRVWDGGALLHCAVAQTPNFHSRSRPKPHHYSRPRCLQRHTPGPLGLQERRNHRARVVRHQPSLAFPPLSASSATALN